MTEAQLQDAVIELARMLGWLVYHTHDSRHSAAGFPDLVLVRRVRLIFAELKSATGVMSPDQKVWRDALLETTTNEVYVWEPSRWLDGTIERVLR